MAIEMAELTKEEEEILGSLASCLWRLRWDFPENKLEPEGLWELWMDIIARTFGVDKDKISDAIFSEFYLHDMVVGNLRAIEGFWYPDD